MNADRPRVLVLSSTYPRWRGDPEPGFVHELSRRLAEEFNVTVIAPHAPGALRQEELDGVNVIRFRYAPTALQRLAFAGGILTNLRKRPWTWLLVPGFLFSMGWNLARQLRKHDFAVIHAHWLIPQVWVAVMVRRLFNRRRIPILATSHGGDLFALKGPIGRMLKKQALEQAEHVTVVSNAMRKYANTLGVPSTKVTVAPMGVDSRGTFIPPADYARDAATILFVGRLVEKKGVDVLLHALPKVLETKPEVNLRIVGDGPQLGALKMAARTLDIMSSVEFVGALSHEDLPREFGQATVFAMPSVETRNGDQEGFGLVAAEAMSCGCPVVASDLHAIRDIVTEGTGVLVPPGNSTALAEAIVALLQQSQRGESMRVRARERALRRFDWTVASKCYSRLIGKLAANEQA